MTRRTDSSKIVRLLLVGALVALTAWLLGLHLRLIVLGPFAHDEYQYAHAGWRIAGGEVIYRDFFEHHQPLVHQLAALAWLGLDDSPTNLGALRWLMTPFLALLLAAGWWINRARHGRLALLTVPALLMVPTLAAMSSQLRPDPIAASFFLAALAVLYPSRLDPRLRAFVCGALLVATFWSTLKVVYYGLPLIAAFGADLVALARRRKEGREKTGGEGDGFLLGDPRFFLLGGVAGLLPIVGYLLFTGSWDEWYRWCIDFSFAHQRHYPGFAWQSNLEQVLRHSFWLLPFAVAGVVDTVRRLRREPAGASHPDVLLLASLATTFVSFAWQTAPYLYSLVPFTVIVTVFAARGVAAALAWGLAHDRRARGGIFALLLLALLFAGELARTGRSFARLTENDNVGQRRVLARLGEMTAVDDPVFHIWGGQISRPAAHFFYFLELATMRLEEERLRRELVPALIESGVTVYVHDRDLFPRLLPAVRAYLLGNFLPHDETLWVYGRRYPVSAGADGAGALDADFVAIRDGRYFVWPLDAVAQGALEVDGRPLTTPVVELAAGRHRLAYRGAAGELYLIWLPRDGRPFPPRPELVPRIVPPEGMVN